MECRAVRARPDKTEDGRLCVSLVLGNMRRVGCIDEVAWAALPPGMAREIAQEMLEAADEIERTAKSQATE